jgi:hypothetical protein
VNAVFSGNQIADTIQNGIQRHSPTVPFIATSGNPGHRATFEGDGNPNETGVPAAPGSLYLRVDQEPATMYLKATGTDTVGWIEIATTGSPR